MIRFDCDYTESAHPRILERLLSLQGEQNAGYGADPHCQTAANYIKTAANAPMADVHFLVGGTQANAAIISAALRPYQGVLSAATGHIACHEAGAIEAGGHKVLTLPGAQGKLTATQIQAAYDAHWDDKAHEHIVQPGMVYISHPTESGTVYSLAELTAISQTCRKLALPLMLDGARLGYGLAALGADVTLPDIARLCDVFCIGGTKMGALFGEAVVIVNSALQRDFRYLMKRQGGLLAKGFLLGIQFECLFEDRLYFELGKHGVMQALKIRQALLDAGVPLQYDTRTNQQFPLVPDALCERLGRDFTFAQWEKPSEAQSVIRLCTSWATNDADVDALLAILTKGE